MLINKMAAEVKTSGSLLRLAAVSSERAGQKYIVSADAVRVQGTLFCFDIVLN